VYEFFGVLQYNGAFPSGRTHLNFFSFSFNMFKGHVFWIRGGGGEAGVHSNPFECDLVSNNTRMREKRGGTFT
jgi:hypothetical protein